MRLKIVSDGHSRTTKLIDIDSGKEISDRVTDINWSCTAGEEAKCTVTLHGVEVDINEQKVSPLKDVDIHCPFCGDVMSADIHWYEAREGDNWVCWECGKADDVVVFNPDELLEIICKSPDDTNDFRNKIAAYYDLENEL